MVVDSPSLTVNKYTSEAVVHMDFYFITLSTRCGTDADNFVKYLKVLASVLKSMSTHIFIILKYIYHPNKGTTKPHKKY